MNTKTPLEIKLAAALPVALAGRADEVRTFKGTANSGKPFGYGGTQAVVDFEGLRHKASVPVLLEHSLLKMAGVCRLSVTADGLIAEGSLLSNEFGTQIAEAADQGFPWEISVYVQAESFEMLEAGASLTVNGGEVHSPAVVMRRCTVREVSFILIDTADIAEMMNYSYSYTYNKIVCRPDFPAPVDPEKRQRGSGKKKSTLDSRRRGEIHQIMQTAINKRPIGRFPYSSLSAKSSTVGA